MVLRRKLAKDFKKIGLICGNLSFKSQLLKVWEVLSFLGKFQLKKPQTFWHFFLSNWCENLKSNIDILYKAVFTGGRPLLLKRPVHSGATSAAGAPKPGKAPIMTARRRCRCRLLFFKIEVRPRPCRPYRVRRPCHVLSTIKFIRQIYCTFYSYKKLCYKERMVKRSIFKPLRKTVSCSKFLFFS